MQRENVIVLDFGGQYNQLVAQTSHVSATCIVRFILTRQTSKKSKP